MTRLESVRIFTKEKKVVAEKIEFNYPGLNFGNTTNQHGRRLEKWSDVSNISSTRVPGKKTSIGQQQTQPPRDAEPIIILM